MNKENAWLVAAAMLVAGPAFAQQSPMPADIAAKLLELGRVIDPPKTSALYIPLHEKEPYAGVKIERDVKYGAAERNLLDVFMPEANSAARPVLIFVHGGGFVRGDKAPPGSPFNDNVMVWAARSGMVGVNINYRLAPKDPWPAGSQDTAAAIAWVRAHIAEHGGDPDRVFIWGHSAGANHVADYISHDEFHPKGTGLAGADMTELGAVLKGQAEDLTARGRPVDGPLSDLFE